MNTWRIIFLISFTLLICFPIKYSEAQSLASLYLKLDRNDFRNDAEFETDPPRIPKFHILSVGSHTYDHFNKQTKQDLLGVIADLENIQKLFSETLKYDYVNGVKKGDDTAVGVNTELVDDEVFYQKQLLPALDNIVEGDVFVFYFSGHGFSVSNQSYIVPRNMKNDGSIIGEAIPLSKIVEYASLKKPGAMIFLIDSCRSDISKYIKMTELNSASFPQVGNFPDAINYEKSTITDIVDNFTPHPTQSTIYWFPTKPFSSAVTIRGEPSPFTQALIKYAEEHLNEKGNQQPSDMKDGLQDLYKKILAQRSLPKQNISMANDVSSRTINSFHLGEDILTKVKNDWKDKTWAAREKNCLEDIKDHLSKYPWSQYRQSARNKLRKWLPAFGYSTDCVQELRIAQVPCSLAKGVRAQSSISSRWNVVVPKQYAGSPMSSGNCDTKTAKNLKIVHSGDNRSAARQKLKDYVSGIVRAENKSFVALSLENSTSLIRPDLDIFASITKYTPFSDFNKTGLSNLANAVFDTKTPIPAFKMQKINPFQIEQNRLVEKSVKFENYFLRESATIKIPGYANEFSYEIEGNSKTEPIDIGRFIGEVKFKIDAMDATSDDYLPILENFIAKQGGREQFSKDVYLASILYRNNPRTNGSDILKIHHNQIVNYLMRLKIGYSKISSARSDKMSVGEDEFSIVFYGIKN